MKSFDAMLVFFLCAHAAAAGIIAPAATSGRPDPGGSEAAALRPGIPGFEYPYVLASETVLSEPAGLLTPPDMRLKRRSGDAPAGLFITDDSVIPDGPGRTWEDGIPEYGAANLPTLRAGGFRETLSDLDFILEGKLRIDWSGAADVRRDENGTRMILSQIPEPASIFMVIFVSVSGLFIRRRFR